MSDDEGIYALVGNIDLDLHTPDFRNFFARLIESEAFLCFHYRHRPHPSGKFNMCICKIKESRFDDLLKLYNKKNWMDREGLVKTTQCSIVKIKLADNASNAPPEASAEDLELLSEADIKSLIESQKIPSWMPQGNVGTPSKVFFDLITNCRLPPSMIPKLGLDFSSVKKLRNKSVYKAVQYNYKTKSKAASFFNSTITPECFDNAITASGKELFSEDDEKWLNEYNKKVKESLCNAAKKSDDDNKTETEDDFEEELEEWDRHEALHDDVTKQDRTSPYFYEHEIELKWEKGGSGLVFYTDDVYWKEQENKDFDAETADDLDVDMSVYYESGGGDRDAKQLIEMRREEMLRSGEKSAKYNDYDELQKKMNAFSGKRKMADVNIGAFERYTKGIGRKVLEKQGWKEGQSVGIPSRGGLKEALTDDGKVPFDKTGIGYYGCPIDREETIKSEKKRREIERRKQPGFIASRFDKNLDEGDTLLTRVEPKMKYRENLH